MVTQVMTTRPEYYSFNWYSQEKKVLQLFRVFTASALNGSLEKEVYLMDGVGDSSTLLVSRKSFKYNFCSVGLCSPSFSGQLLG